MNYEARIKYYRRNVIKELKTRFQAIKPYLCQFCFNFRDLEVTEKTYLRKLREGIEFPSRDNRDPHIGCITPTKITLKSRSVNETFFDRRTREAKYLREIWNHYEHYDQIYYYIISIESYSRRARGSRWTFVFYEKNYYFYCEKCGESWVEST